MKLNDWQLAMLIFVVFVIVLWSLVKKYSLSKGHLTIKSWIRSLNKRNGSFENIIEFVLLNKKPNTREYEKYNLLYSLLEYEAEVNNGGHFQYFENSSGDNYKRVLKALKYIKADETLNNFKTVISKLQNTPSIERSERQQQLSLNKLQNEFFNNEDSFIFTHSELREKYCQFLQDNIDYFIKIIRES